MVVDAVIGSVVVVTPVIAPSQLSVAVGGVNAVNSHCAVSCGSEAESANGGSVSCITTLCVCVFEFAAASAEIYTSLIVGSVRCV